MLPNTKFTEDDRVQTELTSRWFLVFVFVSVSLMAELLYDFINQKSIFLCILAELPFLSTFPFLVWPALFFIQFTHLSESHISNTKHQNFTFFWLNISTIKPQLPQIRQIDPISLVFFIFYKHTNATVMILLFQQSPSFIRKICNDEISRSSLLMLQFKLMISFTVFSCVFLRHCSLKEKYVMVYSEKQEENKETSPHWFSVHHLAWTKFPLNFAR